MVTERREGVLLVPREAVLADKGESVVFVVPAPAAGAEPAAERRLVEPVRRQDREHLLEVRRRPVVARAHHGDLLG